MNKLLLCIVCTAVMLMALCLNAAGAETVNPFQKVETDLTANAETETELRYESVDFAGGASLLRLQAETDSQLSIRIFADSTDSKPAASVVFKRVNKEMRCRLVLDGIHDLIIVIQGSGRLLSWQAFTAQEDIEAAIKASIMRIACRQSIPPAAAMAEQWTNSPIPRMITAAQEKPMRKLPSSIFHAVMIRHRPTVF